MSDEEESEFVLELPGAMEDAAEAIERGEHDK